MYIQISELYDGLRLSGKTIILIINANIIIFSPGYGRDREVHLKVSWPAGIFPVQTYPRSIAPGGMQDLTSMCAS